jgi:hypothetical protein
MLQEKSKENYVDQENDDRHFLFNISWLSKVGCHNHQEWLASQKYLGRSIGNRSGRVMKAFL